jgi:hypothetical protein
MRRPRFIPMSTTTAIGMNDEGRSERSGFSYEIALIAFLCGHDRLAAVREEPRRHP